MKKKYSSVVGKQVKRFRGELIKGGEGEFILSQAAKRVIRGELAVGRVHHNPFPTVYLV